MNSTIDIIGMKWEENMPTILHDMNGVFAFCMRVRVCVWYFLYVNVFDTIIIIKD